MNLFRQGRMFSRIFSSITLLVLVISMISYVSLYIYSAYNIKKEVGGLNISMLRQIKTITDGYIIKKSDEFIMQNFIDNSNNQDMIKIFENEPITNQYLLEYFNNLKEMTIANEYIENVSIFVPAKNLLVSSRGIQFLDSRERMNAFDKEWIDAFYNSDKGIVWMGTRRSENEGNDVITLVRSYPLVGRAVAMTGLVSVDISEKSIYSAIANVSPENYKELFIIDSDGTVISHNNKILIGKSLSEKKYVNHLLASDNESGYFDDKINSVNSVVSFVKSDYNDWKYVVVVEADLFFGLNNAIKIFIITLCIITIILGTIYAFLLSKRMHQPIGELATLANSMVNTTSVKDEFEAIRKTLDNMHTELNDYRILNEKNLPLIKHDFLVRLLNGNITKEEMERSAELLEVYEKSKFYAVLSIAFSYPDNINIYEQKLYEYSVAQIIEDEMHNLIPVITGNKGITIIAGLETDNIAKLDSICAMLHSMLISAESADFYIIQSDIQADCRSVCELYRQVESFEKYLFVVGYNSIISCPRLKASEENHAKPEFNFDKLVSAINAGDRQSVNNIFIKLKNTLYDEEYSYDAIQAFLLNLLNVVSNVITIEGKRDSRQFMKRQDLYMLLKQSETLEETVDWIRGVCAEYIDFTENKEGLNRNEQLIEIIKEYINSNISNDISLDMLAESLYLSKSYISRLFKRESGMNFIDYVSQRRLEAAAELLTQKNMKVKDVCSKLGYNNPTYFIGKFKEYYGVTPKQYQKESKGNNLF